MKNTCIYQASLTKTLPLNQQEMYLRDVSSRVCKKLKQKGCLTQEDIYIIKLKGLCRMLKYQRRQNKADLNSLRLPIENVTSFM